MSIVDDLIASPGLYIGVDRVQGTDLVGSARMVVTALPGNVGVTLDYEIFNPDGPGPVRGHVEHTVIARAHGGSTIMVIADTHAGAAVQLHETDPGVFEPGPDGTPYPMKVVVSMPEPGLLHHHWWYGGPEDGATPKDLAELNRIS